MGVLVDTLRLRVRPAPGPLVLAVRVEVLQQRLVRRRFVLHLLQGPLAGDLDEGEEAPLVRDRRVRAGRPQRGPDPRLPPQLVLALLCLPLARLNGLLEFLHFQEELLLLVRLVTRPALPVRGRRLGSLRLPLLHLPLDRQPPLQQLLELAAPQDLEVLHQLADLRRRGGVVPQGHGGLRVARARAAPRPVQDESVVGAQHLRGLGAADELHRWALLVEHGDAVLVPTAVALGHQLLWVEHVHRLGGLRDVLEEELLVQQPRVDLARRLVPLAHHEDLGRGVPAGLGLGGVHLVEELLEGVQQRRVVHGPEHLGHEGPLRGQVLGGQLQGLQDQPGLRVGLAAPGAPDVGRPVVDHHVEEPALGHAVDELPAPRGGDVTLERGAPLDGLDGVEVEAHDEGTRRHLLGEDLEPAARRRAQVEARPGAPQELELAVELRELEGRPRPVPLLLRQVVEPVEAVLPLCFPRHRAALLLPPPFPAPGSAAAAGGGGGRPPGVVVVAGPTPRGDGLEPPGLPPRPLPRPGPLPPPALLLRRRRRRPPRKSSWGFCLSGPRENGQPPGPNSRRRLERGLSVHSSGTRERSPPVPGAEPVPPTTRLERRRRR